MDGLFHMEVTELMVDVYNEEVEVPVGEKMTLMLTDGTRIIANLRTIVRYPERFDSEYREVYMKGRTYFDVAHDTEHPFPAHPDGFRVKVLGTKFNMSNYDTLDSQIVLVQGTVELKTINNDRVHMKPDELMSLQEGSFTEKRVVNTDEYTCWMQGMINPNGKSVEPVTQRFSHYYGVTILFDDGISADKFYDKLMPGDRVSEALQSIETMT